MKYIFLILLLIIAGGSYKIYQDTQQAHPEKMLLLEEQSTQEIKALLTKAETQTLEYDKLQEQLKDITEKNDAFLEKTSREMQEKLDDIYEEKSLPTLPGNISRATKKQLDELYISNKKIKSELDLLDKKYLSSQRALEETIKKNVSNYRIKSEQAYLAKQKVDSAKDKTYLLDHRAINQKLASFHDSVVKTNENLNKQIRDNRFSYENKKVTLLKRLQANEDKIYGILESVSANIKNDQSRKQARIDLSIDSYDEALQKQRTKFNDESKKLRDSLFLQNREIQKTIRSAEKIDAQFEGDKAQLQKDFELKSLYIQIIGWGLSSVLALVTIMVFLGSKKVKEDPKISYY